MNLISVQLYKPHQDYINNSYTSVIKKNNATFTANTENLNKDVFVQRNIIKQDENLGQFIDNTMDKIYEKDPDTCIVNMQTYSEKMLPIGKKTLRVYSGPIIENMRNKFSRGQEYQRQSLESMNKIRTKIYDICEQYGFNPKELGTFVNIDSSVNRRFDELLDNTTIQGNTTYKFIDSSEKFVCPYKDNYAVNVCSRELTPLFDDILEPVYCKEVLVLPDKNNPNAVIELSRDNFVYNFSTDNNTYKANKIKLIYKDTKNYYDSNNGHTIITAKDGAKLSFDFLIPCNSTGSFILDKKIKTLKPASHSAADSQFYEIKDYKNGIIYIFKNNNGSDNLAYIYDINKNVMFINQQDKATKLVEDGSIVLGTSLYTNLLQPKKPMGACIVLPYDIRKDQNAIKQELEPHILNGVGTGFDLSETKEPVKVLTQLNKLLKEYDNKTQRPPAGIAILDVTHSDIFKFIEAKRNANFNDWRFNISVSVPNDFMQKVAKNETMKLTDGKEVSARSIYSAIINSMHYCGEPGIVFKDNVEAANPLPNHRYKGMASCAEIGLENGEMCLFSHINLSKFLNKKTNKIDFNLMRESTEVLTRLLDNVIDINLAEKVGEDNIASQKRRFGIGVCGFADLLAEMGIPYGSTEAQNILADCLEVINYSSKKASMNLSKEKGSFPLFDESKYSDRDFLIKHRQDSPIKESQWNKLYDDIQVYGLRNATTTALPPTGSSSRIVGASYSIEPYFDLRHNKIFQKKLEELNLTKQQKQKAIDIVNKTGSCQSIEILPKKFRDVFKLGNEINYESHLRMVGIAQKFVDDGISKTVNLENSSTPNDIDNAVKMAYDLNLKGIAVFREGCLGERNQ